MGTYLDIPQTLKLEITASVKLLSVYPEQSPSEAVTMIENVVKACGLVLKTESVELPLPQGAHALASLLRIQPVPFCVVYGLSPALVGAQWELRPYQWMLDGDVRWCFAERPEVINADPERKRQLWSCLKDVKASLS